MHANLGLSGNRIGRCAEVKHHGLLHDADVLWPLFKLARAPALQIRLTPYRAASIFPNALMPSDLIVA